MEDDDEFYDDRNDEYRTYRDRICDPECRGVNNCDGHATCSRCGDVVCGCEIDDESGLCSGCYESRKSCANCGEDFWDGGLTASDGEPVCSQECLDDYESGLESGRIGNETAETV